MKYLIKPTTTNEFWDIPAVLLTITKQDAARLRRARRQVIAACKKLTAPPARRITFYDEIIALTAIETFQAGSGHAQFFEDADDYAFVKVRDDFDANDHQTWRTDCHLLNIHDDGEIWFRLRNKHGEGQLEIQLPAQLYAA
jgi:hypothetical protein